MRIEGELAVRAHVARLFVGQKHFGARAGPFHRAAELAGRPKRRAVLRVR